MENNQRNSPNFLHKGQGKDKHFEAQMKKAFAVFKRKPATMLMVSIETGILRGKYLPLYGNMGKAGLHSLIKARHLPISKHKAGFYTTDTNLFTPHPKLF